MRGRLALWLKGWMDGRYHLLHMDLMLYVQTAFGTLANYPANRSDKECERGSNDSPLYWINIETGLGELV